MKGKFTAKAKSGHLSKSGNKGTMQVAVEFEILTPGAEFASVVWDGYLTDNSAERTIESLRYCGWKGEDLTDLSGIDANEVELVIEEETYEGKTYTKVAWVNQKGGLAFRAPLPADEAKAFAAQMKTRIKAFDQVRGDKKPAAKTTNGAAKSSAGPMAPEPPPLTDKDIPF